MNTRPHITLSLALLLALITATVGCGKGTTQQGTLYSVGVNKSLECYISDSIEAVHASALASMKDAGYTVDKEAIDAREAMVEGRTALDRTVRIKSVKQGEKVTKLEVYVSGDGEAAKTLLDSIEVSAG
jgi:hypothetical protein